VGRGAGLRAVLRGPLRRHWLLLVYVGSVVLVTFQFGGRGIANNIKIFRWSFFHLLHAQDLYQAYPHLYYDVFKYSPSWALLFGPFALPPTAVGFFLWDLCAALLFYVALTRLLPGPRARLALGIAFFEFLAAMQHASSTNAVVTALIILAFVTLEENRQSLAALAIALGALMKLYPLAALAFAVFHPRKTRFGLLVATAIAALVALPLVVTSPGALGAQWRSWGRVLAVDSTFTGFAVMHFLRVWFNVAWPNWAVQLAGTLVLVLPLAVRRDRWAEPHFRRLWLCSVLLYCLIFNHQSERPSFVVGFTGIAIWYAISRPTDLRNLLMLIAFIGVPLLHSDVVPWGFRRNVLLPHAVIAMPCMLLWFVMQVELLRGSRGDERRPTDPWLPGFPWTGDSAVPERDPPGLTEST
jgi:hypothetical protein